jgi:hypothetical protein
MYNVDQEGPPNTVRITSIPAIVTQEKQVIEGRAAVQVWLESFTTPILKKYNPDKQYFRLEQRGRNLQPPMTEALSRKINMSIDEGLKARAPK